VLEAGVVGSAVDLTVVEVLSRCGLEVVDVRGIVVVVGGIVVGGCVVVV
jgi:hypothetical protein